VIESARLCGCGWVWAQVLLLASAKVDLEAGAEFDTLARATAAYQVRASLFHATHARFFSCVYLCSIALSFAIFFLVGAVLFLFLLRRRKCCRSATPGARAAPPQRATPQQPASPTA
jgi:hypothetical protein